ncbi:MAG TPA: hypothetical protein VI078_03600 [bacterium]
MRTAAGALALGVAVALAWPAVASGAGPAIGSYAPGIELNDTGGSPRKVVWGDGGAAATIAYFFDPQSPECLLELSFLDGVFRRARDFGLAVAAVDARGRQPAEVSRAMERYIGVYGEPSFAVLPDPSFRTGRTYGVEKVPVTFVMESHGVVLNRIEGYDHTTAVALARRLEQLLRRERGFFAAELRGAGVTEAEEREAEARLAAASSAKKTAPAARALGVNDHAPGVEFTDLAGRPGRWAWGEGQAPLMRVLAFLGGFSVTSVDALRWLDSLARRGADVGLEALAVDAGGMDAAALAAALERYRRYNPVPAVPVVVDAGGRLAAAFGPFDLLPQTFLLTQDGTIIHRADGFGEEEAGVMTAKVERVFAQAGRPFPAARGSAGPGETTAEAPPAIEEEAPSIRRKREQDERYRSSIVQGDALFMGWEFDRALPYYLAALEVEPRDLHALVRAAQIEERLGDRRQAAEFWQRVLGVRPDHAEARERLGALQPGR